MPCLRARLQSLQQRLGLAARRRERARARAARPRACRRPAPTLAGGGGLCPAGLRALRCGFMPGVRLRHACSAWGCGWASAASGLFAGCKFWLLCRPLEDAG